MLEWFMLFAAGFLAACLLALALAPVQWRRAVRLTEMRIRSRTPLSMAEIQADKDRLRAEFAFALRRLEKTIERLREQNVALRSEMARVPAAETAPATLQPPPARAGMAGEPEAQLADLKTRLDQAEKDAEAQHAALERMQSDLAAKEQDLDEARAGLREANMLVDEQKVRIAALTAKAFSDESRIRHMDTPAKAKQPAQAEQLESELMLARAELSARTLELEELRQQLEAKDRAIEEMRQRIALYDDIASGDGDAAGKIAPLEAARDAAEADKARLAAEVEVLRRELAESRERDRGETDMLRDRLGEIAAKVAYMSTALEGGDPVIEKILREARPGAATADGDGDTSLATLADRIRALRTQKSG